ncbi:butyrophilin subfamily 1 member A1-like [Chanos chanos]|uniref:Butyrophilin subfamily 1 member A1-like n=1 Tax=Chanos chanos TaxID=29144 RepID=A0A6J2VTS8_CHACN|nr:butyrophilin subfamily 1 member A1-like [Chanos chanos]
MSEEEPIQLAWACLTSTERLRQMRVGECLYREQTVHFFTTSSCPHYLLLTTCWLIQPLPVPGHPWSHIAPDFVTGLPPSHGDTVILTIVDRFSIAVHFVALPKLPTGQETTYFLTHYVFRLHVVGTQPVISMEGYSIGKGVSLLCESNDWWPEAEVVWLDNDGNLLPAEDTETLRDPERFHVKKRVTVQDSNTNRFYCRIMLRDHMKETEIVISNQFQVVGPDGPLLVGAGEDLILPCSLKPNISAVDMTVEWFKLPTSDSLVHLYENGVDRSEDQIQSYRGRTSLFKDELQKGNTSLKLSRVKVSDEGEYKCLIRSERWYDDVTVQVNVEAIGTYPVISMEGYNIGKGLSLLCEIKGWNPEPEVLWLDSDGNLLPAEDTETLRDSERFHVQKRVTVQDSNTNRFYCRVILRDHMKEAETVISILTHTFRSTFPAFSTVKVTLDPDTAHPLLILSEDCKQVTHEDTWQDLPDNPKRFQCWYCVLGKEGFSSGKFYYEVQVSGKSHWALGVARASVERVNPIKWCPENGFWTVGLWDESEYVAVFGPSIFHSLKQKPQKVGVFVDYKEGLVSFYNVEAMSHIYSYTGQIFNEEIYPFFDPWHNYGSKNSAPLIITL